MTPKINNSKGLTKGGIIYIIRNIMGNWTTETSSIDLVHSEYQWQNSTTKPIDSNRFRDNERYSKAYFDTEALWVLMGFRVPILFQFRFSKAIYSKVYKTPKPFDRKGLERILPLRIVARPGFEPGLFSSKGRRVASYTIGQSKIAFAKMERKDKIFMCQTVKSHVICPKPLK